MEINLYKGKNKGGKAKSNDGIKINADNFEYNKITNILISSGNVKFLIQKIIITIYSDKIIY